MFDAITIELQLDQDGAVAVNYLLSGTDTPAKIRRSRTSTDTVAADVAQVLAYAIPLLAAHASVAESPEGARSRRPDEFDDASQLDIEIRAKAFASLTRLANPS